MTRTPNQQQKTETSFLKCQEETAASTREQLMAELEDQLATADDTIANQVQRIYGLQKELALSQAAGAGKRGAAMQEEESLIREKGIGL